MTTDDHSKYDDILDLLSKHPELLDVDVDLQKRLTDVIDAKKVQPALISMDGEGHAVLSMRLAAHSVRYFLEAMAHVIDHGCQAGAYVVAQVYRTAFEKWQQDYYGLPGLHSGKPFEQEEVA